MNEWLRLLPLELQDVPVQEFPFTPVSQTETVVGTLPAELINLFSLWMATAKESQRLTVEMRYKPDDLEMAAYYDELTSKAKALEAIFWIGVKEHFQLWGVGQKQTVAIRQDYQVVTGKLEDNMPPFLKGMFGL